MSEFSNDVVKHSRMRIPSPIEEEEYMGLVPECSQVAGGKVSVASTL